MMKLNNETKYTLFAVGAIIICLILMFAANNAWGQEMLWEYGTITMDGKTYYITKHKDITGTHVEIESPSHIQPAQNFTLPSMAVTKNKAEVRQNYLTYMHKQRILKQLQDTIQFTPVIMTQEEWDAHVKRSNKFNNALNNAWEKQRNENSSGDKRDY